MKNLFLYAACLLICAVFLSGCTTGPTKVAANPKPYEIIDYSSGSSWGFSLFWAIPIFTLSRFDSAVEQAVKSKRGDGLIDTEISDTTYWTPLGSIFVTRVKGIVIKYHVPGARQQMIMQQQQQQQPKAPTVKLQPASPSRK